MCTCDGSNLWCACKIIHITVLWSGRLDLTLNGGGTLQDGLMVLKDIPSCMPINAFQSMQNLITFIYNLHGTLLIKCTCLKVDFNASLSLSIIVSS